MYRWCVVIAFLAALIATGVTSESETSIGLDEVPGSVRDLIVQHTKGARNVEVTKESEQHEEIFDAEWTVDGHTVEISITATGDLLESEESVSFDSLPEAVTQTIKNNASGSHDIKVFRKQVVQFAAEFESDEQDIELLISPSGKLISREFEDEDTDESDSDDKEEDDEDDEDDDDDGEIKLSDCPTAVARTLRREANGSEIEEIERSNEDGTMVYQAEIAIDGRDYQLQVRSDGVLLKKELDEDD